VEFVNIIVYKLAYICIFAQQCYNARVTVKEEGSGTRGEILRLMRVNGGRTARQLAADLGITSMGVRRHLMTLERDGLVSVETKRQPAGRPTFVYMLTDEGYDSFPRSYHLLATQLLEGVRIRDGEAKVQELFAGRMDQLMAQYEPRMWDKDLAGRVEELARIQAENGYMAIWEPVEGGYLLREQNCAIYRVACRFQEACQYEIELFRRLLDAEVSRIDHQVKGDLACTYLVRERRRTARLRRQISHNKEGSNSNHGDRS
jgi:predicted ArsR family transcriptional regulator